MGLRLAVFATIIILVFSLISGPSVVDATTGRPTADALLDLPTGYVFLSPLSRSLDALSLLSIVQQVALLLSLIGIAVVCAVVVSRLRDGPGSLQRTLRWSGFTVGVLALLNVAALVAPRPMASLAVSHPRLLRVDFHSHTNASHDARKGFTPEANRKWHRDGGFDVAYVSDHRTYSGAALGESHNPPVAGSGTVLLSALEARYHGMFTIILGIKAVDSALINRRRHLLPGLLRSGRQPLSIAAIPGPLSDVEPIARDEPPNFAAIELVNAAPRGLGQRDREELEIRRRSAALGLAMVAGSNNHGWGRTVAAWSLIDIDGWKSLPPDSLGVLIEGQLRQQTPGSVRISERVRPRTSGMMLPLTLPVILTQTLRTLTLGERAVWILWIWSVGAVAAVARGRRKKSS